MLWNNCLACYRTAALHVMEQMPYTLQNSCRICYGAAAVHVMKKLPCIRYAISFWFDVPKMKIKQNDIRWMISWQLTLELSTVTEYCQKDVNCERVSSTFLRLQLSGKEFDYRISLSHSLLCFYLSILS